jgi:hypothetical protein
MKSSAVLLFSGLAAATWDRNAGHFNSPTYNNNECSDKQNSGYDWSDLPTGGFSGYDDFNFSGGSGGSGWSCANSFGKRDSLTKRSFNNKCIKNRVSKDTAAALDCSAKQEGFSVKEIQVSVEYDCDLEFHYTMPDSSVCKQTSSCKKEGTTVENTQCGGAQSVQVYLGNHDQGDKEDCEIGFHSIGFDCNPGYVPSTTSSAPAESSTKPAESTSEVPATTTEAPAESSSTAAVESSSLPVYSTGTVPYANSTIPVETATSFVPETTAPVDTPETTVPAIESSTAASETIPSYETSVPVVESSSAVSETVPAYQTSSAALESSSAAAIESSSVQLTTSVVYSTLTSTVTSCAAEVTDCPAEQASTVIITSEIIVGTTVCPVTETAPVSAPATTTTAAPQSSSPPSGGYTPPDVLPKCMNTWLEINSECKDNTDASCYCGNADFTKNVIDCVAAWTTDAEIQQALQYLIGICANYVPQNPGLITNCPSTVPLNPTTSVGSSAAPSSAASSSAVESGSVVPSSSVVPSGEVPASSAAPSTTAAAITTPAPSQAVTTITYQTIVTVPYTTVSEGSTMSSQSESTISTSITVPQIVFTTQPAASVSEGASTTSQEVALVPGTPAPVLASTTAAPYPISGVPTTLGTGVVPSGSAVYTAPPEFTGAASPLGVSVTPALFGAVLAFLAL